MGPEEAQPASAFARTVLAIAENVAPIRHAVVDLARRAGADEDVCTDLALAVGEACANVVVHAYGIGEAGPLAVKAEIKDDVMQLYVIDRGSGMTPRPDSPGLGLGLPLIANLADKLEIQDGPEGHGTELSMSFSLRRSPPRGP